MSDKKAVVVHSGGMDSSLCLALAIRELGEANVVSLSFDYGQRHSNEIRAGQKNLHRLESVLISILKLDFLPQLMFNALIDRNTAIQHSETGSPNTLVTGRNGLMAWLATLYAHQ